MKRIILSVFIFIVSMATVLTPALGQGDGETQTFTSPDGNLTLEYPDNWTLIQEEGVYVLATSEELASSDLPDTVPSGDMVLGILPAIFLPDLGLEADETPANVVDTISGAFIAEKSDAVENDFDGNTAMYVTGSDGSTDYLVLAIGFEGGTFTLIGLTALGEMESALPTFLSIAESMRYTTPEPIDASNLGVITLDNAGSLREVLDLSNENYDIRHVAVSEDGALVALNYYSYFEDAESDYGLTIVDVATGEVILQMDSPQYENIAFSEDNSQLLYTREEYDDDYELVGSFEGFVDIATGDSAEAELQALVTLYFDVNGEAAQLLATISEDETSAHIIIADPETADVTTEFDLGLEGLGQIYDLNPDASAFIVSSEASLHLLDTATGELSEPLYTSTAEYPEFDTAAFSPDGSLVALTEYDTNSVYIVDVASNEIVATVDLSASSDALDHATFNADGSVLFIVKRAGIVVIDVANGEILTELPQIVDGNLEDFNISADGRVIVGGGYEAVMIWGVAGE